MAFKHTCDAFGEYTSDDVLECNKNVIEIEISHRRLMNNKPKQASLKRLVDVGAVEEKTETVYVVAKGGPLINTIYEYLETNKRKLFMISELSEELSISRVRVKEIIDMLSKLGYVARMNKYITWNDPRGECYSSDDEQETPEVCTDKTDARTDKTETVPDETLKRLRRTVGGVSLKEFSDENIYHIGEKLIGMIRKANGGAGGVSLKEFSDETIYHKDTILNVLELYIYLGVVTVVVSETGDMVRYYVRDQKVPSSTVDLLKKSESEHMKSVKNAVEKNLPLTKEQGNVISENLVRIIRTANYGNGGPLFEEIVKESGYPESVIRAILKILVGIKSIVVNDSRYFVKSLD